VGKVCWITGGASGIGKEFVILALKKGAKIAFLDKDLSIGEQLEAKLQKEYGVDRVVFFPCDVANFLQLSACYKAALDYFKVKCLDVVVNNAGFGHKWDPTDTKNQQWKAVVDVCLSAVIAGTQLATANMAQHGGGAIVNVASIAGLEPYHMEPVYCAAKHGVVGFSRSLKHLHELYSIRVNVICPSLTDTPFMRRTMEESQEYTRYVKTFGFVKPELVAEGILRLATDESLSGTVMRVTPQKGIDFFNPRKHPPAQGAQQQASAKQAEGALAKKPTLPVGVLKPPMKANL